MKFIEFYDAKKAHGFLSNFYISPITIQGITYSSVEHFFQASKFDDPWYRDQIIKAKTPAMAKYIAAQKIIGRWPWQIQLDIIIENGISRGVHIRENWDKHRIKVMIKGVLHKFKNPTLRKMLLDTDRAILIEASPRDNFWGWGKDKKGKNMLGKILMCVRDKIKI